MNTQQHYNDPELTEAEAAAIADKDDATAVAAAQATATPTPEPEPVPQEPTPSANDEAAARLVEAANKIAAAADTIAAQQQASAQAAAAANATPEPAPRDFAAEIAALQQQFEDGELTQSEYLSKHRELVIAEARHVSAETVRQEREQAAREAEQRAEQEANARWEEATGRFFADPGNARLLADPVQKAAFEAAVKVVYAEQNGQIAYDDLLVKARERVTGVPAVDPQAATRKATFERQKQADDVPVTLRDVPAAANPDTDAGASLDNLPIDQLEDALARMPDSDRARYRAGAPGGLNDNPRAL